MQVWKRERSKLKISIIGWLVIVLINLKNGSSKEGNTRLLSLKRCRKWLNQRHRRTIISI